MQFQVIDIRILTLDCGWNLRPTQNEEAKEINSNGMRTMYEYQVKSSNSIVIIIFERDKQKKKIKMLNAIAVEVLAMP